jgi:glucose uptake protein GlcU
MPYAPYGRGPVYMAAAGLVAVIALILGILMLADHKSNRGVIFIVAAVLAVAVAVLARPRRS